MSVSNFEAFDFRFESFAQSLEGRGSNLLVDFSRTPRGFAAPEEEAGDVKKKEKQQWQQKGKGVLVCPFYMLGEHVTS